MEPLDNPEANISPEKSGAEEIPCNTTPAPCKLLTLLAGNPNADITQLPEVTNVESYDGVEGVECSRAREMLMRHATTEEKIDEVARGLEKGCVRNKRGGGCHVKNDVVLRLLDHVSS
jgi:hypothetical protein